MTALRSCRPSSARPIGIRRPSAPGRVCFMSLHGRTPNPAEAGGGGRGAANTTPMGGIALAPNAKTEEEGYGVVRAFDMRTLDQKWEFKMNDITWAGVLSTAGDVVFSGGREGYFFALDARSGELLWKIPLGGQVNSGPMSYSVNGRQYIAVAAGTALFSFALRQ